MKPLKFLMVTLALSFFSISVNAQNNLAQFTNHTTKIANSEIAPIQYTNSGAQIISTYQEGLAITRMGKKYGFVNKQGQEICDPHFQETRLFENGYAAAKQHGKWSFINKQGKKITSFRFDWVGGFRNGAAPVQIDGKWGLLNEQGLMITDLCYDKLQHFQDGRALAQRNNKWFWINEQGKEIPARQKTEQAAKIIPAVRM